MAGHTDSRFSRKTKAYGARLSQMCHLHPTHMEHKVYDEGDDSEKVIIEISK